MRPLRRHLFTFCSAASLLACVALGLLWASSYEHWYVCGVGTVTHGPWKDEARASSYDARLANGGMVIEVTRYRWVTPGRRPAPEMPGFRVGSMPAPHGPLGQEMTKPGVRWWGGFAYSYGHSGPGGPSTSHARGLRVPCWFLAALLSAMPALWLNRLRNARRAKGLGLCPACGYDLRASPDRCPECGTIAATASPRPGAE